MKKLTIVLASLLPYLLAAQIYYWMDDQGVKHYSSFPPENRESVKDFMKMESSSPVVPRQENATQETETANDTSAIQGEFVQEDPVLIFTEHACPKCAVAVSWCRRNGIQYRELNIESSEEYKALYDKLGGLDTPYLVYGNRRMMGWNQGIVESWFNPNKSARLEEQVTNALNQKPVQ